MPAERMSMRKIRDVLRLTHAMGMSRRVVGEVTGIGKTAVGDYVRRASAAGLTWPIPEAIDDAELERRLFPPADGVNCTTRAEPDWAHIHAELKRRGVTLALLWQEYRAEHPGGCAYSWFCERYGAWRKGISPTMRQTHVAGEKLFVDWAGDTLPVFDPTTGEEHRAHIFVAALGASNYTYAEARWTETLPDWIGAHVNALIAIGGVPKALVPDNLKAGITKPSRFEPGINRTYQDLADHYGCVVLPARVMKPRDKAKVEVAVQIVQRIVLAKLRHRRFFSWPSWMRRTHLHLSLAMGDCAISEIGDRLVSTLDHTLKPEATAVRELEVVPGTGRRRQFSKDFKASIVEETLVPGAVTQRAAAERAPGLQSDCRGSQDDPLSLTPVARSRSARPSARSRQSTPPVRLPATVHPAAGARRTLRRQPHLPSLSGGRADSPQAQGLAQSRWNTHTDPRRGQGQCALVARLRPRSVRSWPAVAYPQHRR